MRYPSIDLLRASGIVTVVWIHAFTRFNTDMPVAIQRIAFLTRFATWQSRNSSVLDPHRSPGRIERFFGPLYGQTSGLLDDRWITDRFLFTGPMLFLMAAAIAALIRYRLTGRPTTPQSISEVEL